jgi:hypothetical protein
VWGAIASVAGRVAGSAAGKAAYSAATNMSAPRNDAGRTAQFAAGHQAASRPQAPQSDGQVNGTDFRVHAGGY